MSASHDGIEGLFTFRKCPPRTSLTALAHERLAQCIGAADQVLDATAGNGYDTLFLAERVGPGGRVFAIDLQANAIRQTRERLTQAGLDARVTLLQGDHGKLGELLSPAVGRWLCAAVFNLGYLPGSDRTTTTLAGSTRAALDQVLSRLRPGGALSVLSYRAHPGGEAEFTELMRWFSANRAAFETLDAYEPEAAAKPPILLFGQMAVSAV